MWLVLRIKYFGHKREDRKKPCVYHFYKRLDFQLKNKNTIILFHFFRFCRTETKIKMVTLLWRPKSINHRCYHVTKSGLPLELDELIFAISIKMCKKNLKAKKEAKLWLRYGKIFDYFPIATQTCDYLTQWTKVDNFRLIFKHSKWRGKYYPFLCLLVKWESLVRLFRW